MDIITQLITSVGFPITACVATAWYVKYLTDLNTEEVKEMRKEHAEEVGKISEALNNNTLALQKLIDHFSYEDKGENDD